MLPRKQWIKLPVPDFSKYYVVIEMDIPALNRKVGLFLHIMIVNLHDHHRYSSLFPFMLVIFNSINISYIQSLWRFEKPFCNWGGILASNSMSNQTFGFRVCVWTAFHFPKRRILIKGFLIILIVRIPRTNKKRKRERWDYYRYLQKYRPLQGFLSSKRYIQSTTKWWLE
jgi:hypothetical protein